MLLGGAICAALAMIRCFFDFTVSVSTTPSSINLVWIIGVVGTTVKCTIVDSSYEDHERVAKHPDYWSIALERFDLIVQEVSRAETQR